jgi:hypothetical protein
LLIKAERMDSSPLLKATGQQRKLSRVGYCFFLGFALVTAAQWLPLHAPKYLFMVLVAAGGVAMLAAASYALYAIKCPRCDLAWVRWSIGHQSVGNWLHWLYQFKQCPRCGHNSASKSQ